MPIDDALLHDLTIPDIEEGDDAYYHREGVPHDDEMMNEEEENVSEAELIPRDDEAVEEEENVSEAELIPRDDETVEEEENVGEAVLIIDVNEELEDDNDPINNMIIEENINY